MPIHLIIFVIMPWRPSISQAFILITHHLFIMEMVLKDINLYFWLYYRRSWFSFRHLWHWLHGPWMHRPWMHRHWVHGPCRHSGIFLFWCWSWHHTLRWILFSGRYISATTFHSTDPILSLIHNLHDILHGMIDNQYMHP